MTDVEMKSTETKAVDPSTKAAAAEPEEPNDQFYELKKCLVICEKAAKESDTRTFASLTKEFKKLRKLFSLQDTVLVLQFYLSDLAQRLNLPCPATQLESGVTVEDKLHCKKDRASEIMQHAEAQLLVYVLLLMKLIDDGDLKNAKEFGDFIFQRLKGANKKTLDHFSAKAVYFVSVAYEKQGILTQIRCPMFDLYKEFCLEQNQIGQATVMNIIIRSYLSQNLYEQASNFINKTTFPESVSNNQYARYLYYVGRIKAVQLEYSEALNNLTQSQRKGPEHGAFGFRVQVQKLLLIVELLMGEIPNRQIFSQTDFQKALYPYFQIVSTVKQGDMEKFKQLVDKYQRIFQADRVLTLIQRLKHTVIKFGLKKINVSYSKISLKDIQTKLSIESVEETEQIVAKAIRDGVIEAQINHDEQYISSLPITDVYSTNDPQVMLNKRIKFCIDLRNDAIKALAHAPSEDKKDFAEDEDENKEEQEDLLSRLLDEMGFDF